MKALSLKNAEKLGFKTFRYGFRSYVPVVLPNEIAFADHDVLLDQFDPRFEVPDAREGKFTQIVEDTRGRMGLPGTLYIAEGYYSHNGGVEEWKFYGAVEIK